MHRTVGDVMTKTVVAVDRSTPFKELVRHMHEYRISALPVVDAPGKLVGIVSEGDLILKEDLDLEDDGFLFEGRRRRRKRAKAVGLTAAEVMSSPVVTIGPAATLGEAARLMHDRGLKRLPVVSAEGEVLGIVSRADLLKVFLRDDAEIAKDIRTDVIHGTLWIDPATIRVEVNGGVVTLVGQIEQRSLIPVLVGLVRGVDGVVGVDSHLSFQVDDTAEITEVYPWVAFPQGSRAR